MNYDDSDALRTMLRRVALASVDDTGAEQTIAGTGLRRDAPTGVTRVQTHGLSSHPPAGATGLLAALGGRSDRLFALGLEHPDHRPRNLPEGGTALYDSGGNIIRLIGDQAVFAFDAHGWSVTAGSVNVAVSAGHVVVNVPDPTFKVWLGGDPANSSHHFARVATEAGLALNVMARVP